MSDLETIKKDFLNDLAASDNSPASLESIKVKYVGRKNGAITNLLAELPGKSVDEKRVGWSVARCRW
jgi:hypothetical protein